MRRFCESLREHALLKLLTKELQESYENAKICYICKEKFEHRGAAHSIFNLKYSLTKNVPTAFPNGSNYDYHFIIKELAEELKKQFICLGENSEKYKPLQYQ